MEKWLNQKILHEGAIFSLVSGEAELDDGSIAKREIVRHKGSVAIVPILKDKVILVKQYRISVEKEMLEIPAGRIDTEEAPIIAAERELEEETGYRSSKLIQGPVYYPSVGFLDEKLYLFFAYDLVKLNKAPKGDDKVDPVLLSFDEIEEKLNASEFDDSKTIIGLREMLARREKPLIDEKTLYSWYTDENHKYNTIIWQFPAAIILLNVFVVNGIYSAFQDLKSWQVIAALILIWFLNRVLLFTLAKHIYHQRGFTKAIENIHEQFHKKHPQLRRLLVDFSDKDRGPYKKKATHTLLRGLKILNYGYIIYLIYYIVTLLL